MAKPILVANWKNYPHSLREAKILLTGLSRSKRFYKRFALFVAPPLPYLESVLQKLGNLAHLACQNISLVNRGTHTGIVTTAILKSFGTRLVILGHSEMRALGETSDTVSKKAKMAARAGLIPLVCVGEESRDRDGQHFEFLREEIKSSLSSLGKGETLKLMVAYEPVWAVGEHAFSPIEPADLAESVIFVKKVLSDMFGRKTADRIPILYGGSVDETNAKALLGKTGIRGFLVGRASLKVKSFESIAKAIFSK